MGTEVITYSRIGKEDIRFGKGTFEVVLADGRKVVLHEVDLGSILNDPTLTSQADSAFTFARYYSTVQDAIDATPSGGTLIFDPIEYTYSTLTTDKPITLLGSGWQTTSLDTFGGSIWSSTTRTSGTVLRSTATSGASLTFTNSSYNQAYNLSNIALVGPGTGTSTGVQLGQTGVAAVMGIWSNVLIANFSTGLDGVWEDYAFHSLRMRGNTTNMVIAADTNQNGYYNCEFQRATTSLKFTGGLVNTFYGGLFQSNTIGILFDSGSPQSIKFDGIYFEGNTTASVKFDCTTGAYTQITFEDTRNADSGAIGFVFAGSTTLNGLNLIRNQWAGIDVTLPSNTLNTLYENNNFGTYTDNGLLTSYCEVLKGTATFATAGTKSVAFGYSLNNTLYRVVLGGQANETFWVTNKLSTGFTLNSSNSSSTATVDWHIIR